MNGGEMIGGVEQGSDGNSNFRMDNIPPGTRVLENPSRPSPTQQGLQNYNNFYDRYTGLINTLNGIGGGVPTRPAPGPRGSFPMR
ncbi:MAG TPA: hypothetical protein VL326_11805 [Kofleriaceae bacterium]|nr:hypothetical protein [Kofleriaceae bacterium]